MKLNHLIVAAKDVQASVSFYCELLGFEKTGGNPGRDGGQILEHSGCELLVLPFLHESLPNPSHFALETENREEFDRVLLKASRMGLNPRSLPARDSRPGPGEFQRGNRTYLNFYVFDPSGVNLEVMTDSSTSPRV